MPCGWEGNRRSGVALAMRHRLQRLIHLRAHGLDREMSTPPTLSCGVRPIYLTCKNEESPQETEITRVVLPYADRVRSGKRKASAWCLFVCLSLGKPAAENRNVASMDLV